MRIMGVLGFQEYGLMKFLHSASVAVAALGTSVGGAMAADIYTPPPPIESPIYSPAPVLSWTGLYIGVHGGYGWGSAQATHGNGTASAADTSPSGWLAGGQIGANYQFENGLVIGIEGDISGSGLNASWSGAGTGGTGPVTINQKTSMLGSVRGRLGFAAGNWMPYLTAGVGFAKSTRYYDGLGGPASDTKTHTGWTAGAGLEYAMSQNWSIRGEYRYSDYGSQNYAMPGPGGLGTNVKLTNHQFALGLNYKF